jgi:hypothetical protein
MLLIMSDIEPTTFDIPPLQVAEVKNEDIPSMIPKRADSITPIGTAFFIFAEIAFWTSAYALAAYS